MSIPNDIMRGLRFVRRHPVLSLAGAALPVAALAASDVVQPIYHETPDRDSVYQRVFDAPMASPHLNRFAPKEGSHDMTNSNQWRPWEAPGAGRDKVALSDNVIGQARAAALAGAGLGALGGGLSGGMGGVMLGGDLADSYGGGRFFGPSETERTLWQIGGGLLGGALGAGTGALLGGAGNGLWGGAEGAVRDVQEHFGGPTGHLGGSAMAGSALGGTAGLLTGGPVGGLVGAGGGALAGLAHGAIRQYVDGPARGGGPKAAAASSGRGMFMDGVGTLVDTVLGRKAPAGVGDVLGAKEIDDFLAGPGASATFTRGGMPARGKQPAVAPTTHTFQAELPHLRSRAAAGDASAEAEFQEILRQNPEFAASAARARTRLDAPGWQQRFAPAGLIAAGAGIALGDPLLDLAKPTISATADQIRDKVYPWYDQIDPAEMIYEEAVGGVAKGIGGLAQSAFKAVPDAIEKRVNNYKADGRLEEMLSNDRVLSQASNAERDLLGRAYTTMHKTAPTLAKDPFASQNYLRTVLTMGEGPDYATLGQLAAVERDLRNRDKPKI